VRLWRGGRGTALFPKVSGNAQGNNLPGITGTPFGAFRGGPGLSAGGQLGAYDGSMGADPAAPKVSPWPHFLRTGGQGVNSDSGEAGGRQSWWRNGFIGFSDKLTVKDRHAYWDTGTQKTGITGFGPAGLPNTYNDPRQVPPRPDLRTVNRTISYQKGSDATRNQDDLRRPYTWLGEQGSGWTKVNGGVPGLYQPYGTRGGVPFPIVSPVEEGADGDGPHLVFAGPPHGLHSTTPWKGGAQYIRRISVIPQTRPVRFDRPSNSPQAGQSYSQTVRPQGASRVRPATRAPQGAAPGAVRFAAGRGWAGRPWQQ